VSEACVFCEDRGEGLWKGAFDLFCDDCCVRLIENQPTRERRASMLDIIRKRRGTGTADRIQKIVEDRWLKR
jgi:hypothetical protein